MSRFFLILFFVFISLYFNQDLSAGKKGKIEEEETDFPIGISKNIKKSSQTQKNSTSDFQSMVKPIKFPTPRQRARKNRIQRMFWEYASKIEEERNKP